MPQSKITKEVSSNKIKREVSPNKITKEIPLNKITKDTTLLSLKRILENYTDTTKNNLKQKIEHNKYNQNKSSSLIDILKIFKTQLDEFIKTKEKISIYEFNKCLEILDNIRNEIYLVQCENDIVSRKVFVMWILMGVCVFMCCVKVVHYRLF